MSQCTCKCGCHHWTKENGEKIEQCPYDAQENKDRCIYCAENCHYQFEFQKEK